VAVNHEVAGSNPAGPASMPASHSWERTSFVKKTKVVRLHSPALSGPYPLTVGGQTFTLAIRVRFPLGSPIAS
jgi:hypothetical protein